MGGPALVASVSVGRLPLPWRWLGMVSATSSVVAAQRPVAAAAAGVAVAGQSLPADLAVHRGAAPRRRGRGDARATEVARRCSQAADAASCLAVRLRWPARIAPKLSGEG